MILAITVEPDKPILDLMQVNAAISQGIFFFVVLAFCSAENGSNKRLKSQSCCNYSMSFVRNI